MWTFNFAVMLYSIYMHVVTINVHVCKYVYSGADKSLARARKIQATGAEDLEFHISYL